MFRDEEHQQFDCQNSELSFLGIVLCFAVYLYYQSNTPQNCCHKPQLHLKVYSTLKKRKLKLQRRLVFKKKNYTYEWNTILSEWFNYGCIMCTIKNSIFKWIFSFTQTENFTLNRIERYVIIWDQNTDPTYVKVWF